MTRTSASIPAVRANAAKWIGAATSETSSTTKVKMSDRPDWNDYFMGIARAVARRSDCERDRVGAVVVKARRVRSTGYNGSPAGHAGCVSCPRRTSGVSPGSSYDNCIAVHAEANALLYCDREDLVGATLYVTREPCRSCWKLIDGAGVENVVWPGKCESHGRCCEE